MTFEDFCQLGQHDPPVHCADGSMGLLIHWNKSDDTGGVQVPGEEDARRIPARRLLLSGGAIIESYEVTDGG